MRPRRLDSIVFCLQALLVVVVRSLICCENYDCTRTCKARSNEKCLRGLCSQFDRFLYDQDICPTGCGIPKVRAKVFAGALKHRHFFTGKYFRTFCSTDRCNFHKSRLEQCDWAPRIPMEELECSCTTNGMFHNHHAQYLNLLYGNHYHQMGRFCRKGVCRFKEIADFLKKNASFDPMLLWGRYACRYEQWGGVSNSINFGCDFFPAPPCTYGDYCSQTRFMYYDSRGDSPGGLKQNEIYCNDAHMCNHPEKMREIQEDPDVGCTEMQLGQVYVSFLASAAGCLTHTVNAFHALFIALAVLCLFRNA